MIDLEYTLDKNDFCYSLLSSYNHPNILIPIKGQILDVKINPNEILYQMRILYFYDDIYFLKNHLYNMLFYDRFNYAHKIKLPFPNSKSTVDLNSFLKQNKITVVNTHLMTFSNKTEMLDVFDKLNFYFINLSVYNLKVNLMRAPYRGAFKLISTRDFDDRFKRFLGDKLDENDMKLFLEEVTRTKSIFSETYKSNGIKRTRPDNKNLNKKDQVE